MSSVSRRVHPRRMQGPGSPTSGSPSWRAGPSWATNPGGQGTPLGQGVGGVQHNSLVRPRLNLNPGAGPLLRLGVELVIVAYERDPQATLARLADVARREDEPFQIPLELLVTP